MSLDSELLWKIFEKVSDKTYASKIVWSAQRAGKLSSRIGDFLLELEPGFLSVFDPQMNLLGTVTNSDSSDPLSELTDVVGSLYTEARRQALKIPDQLKKLNSTLDNIE